MSDILAASFLRLNIVVVVVVVFGGRGGGGGGVVVSRGGLSFVVNAALTEAYPTVDFGVTAV